MKTNTATNVSADAFRDACSGLGYFTRSLISAANDLEVANEADSVRRLLAEVEQLVPKRPSSALEHIRAKAIAYARATLLRRTGAS